MQIKSMISPSISERLQCPDCGGNINENIDRIYCVGCEREFQFLDGILLMMPLTEPRDTRSIECPDHQKWMNSASEMLDEYFENGNSAFNLIHHSSHRRIAQLSAHAKGFVLDLGCGQGAHFPYHNNLENVVGVDISLKSLQGARQRNPNVTLIQGSAYSLPIKPASFDKIVSVYNLEHVYHLELAIEEINRVLSKNGYLYVGLPCEGGVAWNTGRRLTSERAMSQRFNLDYSKVIAIEHCNTAKRVLDALDCRFKRRSHSFFPFSFFPLIGINLTVTTEYIKYNK